MERRLWDTVYRTLVNVFHQLAPSEKASGVVYSDLQVVAMFFWSVINDRNQKWACQPENWPRLPAEWPGLISEAQFSRRLRSKTVQGLLDRAEETLRREQPEEWCLIVDGKPLPVGGFSKDPDAARGFGAGEKFRGYKLHAIWGNGPIPWAWDVQPANVAEPTTAAELVASVPGEGYLLGDASYDSNSLYNASASVGRSLVAPRKKPGTGLGKGTEHHPQRLRSIELTEHMELHPFARALHNWRSGIERQFGWLTTRQAGLQNLPSFVRRLPRVRRWIQAKLILNALSS
jgi:hypothetical protein